MPTTHLRKATIEDIPLLIAVEKKLVGLKIYSAGIDEKEWKEVLGKENEVVYLILLDGEVVGNISYERKLNETAYIDGFAIDPKFQKQGIGRQALKMVIDELAGAKRIELVTHPENTAAIKLYLSFGFAIKSRIENYFGDGEPRIQLVKENSVK